MVFEAMPDVDCAVASEGSYGPIERLPLVPGGVELLAFVDRKHGIRHVETMPTHRTTWRLQRFASGRSRPAAGAEGHGLPAVRRVRGLQQRHEPADQEPRDGRRGDRGDGPRGRALRGRAGGALLRHARAQEPDAHAGAARRGLQARQAPAALCPKCHAPGYGPIGSRRGLPCETCGEPTHWIDFEIDGCSVCGHATSRPRKDGRKTAPRLMLQSAAANT